MQKSRVLRKKFHVLDLLGDFLVVLFQVILEHELNLPISERRRIFLLIS